MNSTKKKVTSGVKWTTISTIIIAIAALLKLSVLTRFLDKSDFGLMALVTFVMGFMNLFNDMGLTSAILHKKNISKNEYASLYWFNILFSFFLYAILCLISPFVASFYGEPLLATLIPLLGLNLLISAVGRIFKTMDYKHLEFKMVSIFEIISAILSLLAAVYFAIEDYGVYALVYAALVQYIVQNILFLIYGFKRYGLLFHFRLFEIKPFLKIGVYQVGGQIVNYFNRDIDILIIGKFFSSEILGGYSLAKQLVFRPAQILNPIITKVASPRLSLIQDELTELKSNYLRLISIVSKLNIIIYLLIILFAPFIVIMFYGNGYDEVVVLVQILSIYMVFRAIGNPVGSLIIATGKTKIEFFWNIVVLVIIPIFVFIGAHYSIIHVAWGLNLASLLLFYPAWKLLVNRLIGGTFKEYLRAIFLLK